MSNETKVQLRSSDNVVFEVKELVASESKMVRDLIEAMGIDSVIPLPSVSSKVLEKVIEYYNYHVDARASSDDKPAVSEVQIKQWDAEFVKIDQRTMFDLIVAANYLNAKDLLDLMCQTVADIIMARTPEEIRQTFNIKNDFTPEEEESVRRENQWAFD